MKTLTIAVEYENGDYPVYLKTDRERHKRQITAIEITPGNNIKYCLTLDTSMSYHSACEITRNKQDKEPNEVKGLQHKGKK